MRTPVLVLSALGAVDDRVRGLRMGGDDYLTKPFAIVELVARIEALLRRPVESRETTLQVGPLELDLIERTARRGDRVIDLLPREFRLLEYMMRRSDQLLTRAMLLEEVWNYKFVPATNLVDVHMGRLRHKVDGPGEAPMIHNVRGAGFILRAGPLSFRRPGTVDCRRRRSADIRRDEIRCVSCSSYVRTPFAGRCMVAGVFAAFIIALFGFIYWTDRRLSDRAIRPHDRDANRRHRGHCRRGRRLEAIDEHLRQDSRGVQFAGLFGRRRSQDRGQSGDVCRPT